MGARYAFSFFIAGFVAFGLFFVMLSLISTREGNGTILARDHGIDFVRLRRETETEARKRTTPEKPEPKLEPEPLPAPKLDAARVPSGVGLRAEIPEVDLDLDFARGFDLGGAPSDAEATPILRVLAVYPPRALDRGIEGSVLVEFTVSATGTVMDPVIVESEPSAIFDRSALGAVRKWKYKPKVVDGVAVERRGVRTKIRFELPE